MKPYLAILGFLALALLFAASAGAGEVCLGLSQNGNNGTVDCDPIHPLLHDNAVIGYSTDGPPCTIGSCGFEPAQGGNMYGWSISASDVDPFVNTGPLPLGVVFLNLWIHCTLTDGWIAAEMSISTTDPELILLAFLPLNGVLSVGTLPDLLIAVGGCPSSLLAGQLLLLNTGPVSVEAETWGGIKAMYR